MLACGKIKYIRLDWFSPRVDYRGSSHMSATMLVKKEEI